MKRTTTIMASAATLVLLTGTADAHAPVAGGVGAGLTHPFTGLDHLLAMVAVGVFAAMRPTDGNAWRAPALFILMLTVGAGLGLAGTALPFVEAGIALSIVLLGMMIAFAGRLPETASLAAIAAFALMHGHAHGTEATGAAGLFVAGMIAASAALHAGGYVLGRALIARVPHAGWLAGGAMGAAGLALLGA